MNKDSIRKYRYYRDEWTWYTDPHEFENVQIGLEATRITMEAAFDVFALGDEADRYDWRYLSAVELRNAQKFRNEVIELEDKARRALDCDICALARCISRVTGMDIRYCLVDVDEWYRAMYDLRFGKVA